jgi:hypothetical protein
LTINCCYLCINLTCINQCIKDWFAAHSEFYSSTTTSHNSAAHCPHNQRTPYHPSSSRSAPRLHDTSPHTDTLSSIQVVAHQNVSPLLFSAVIIKLMYNQVIDFDAEVAIAEELHPEAVHIYSGRIGVC